MTKPLKKNIKLLKAFVVFITFVLSIGGGFLKNVVYDFDNAVLSNLRGLSILYSIALMSVVAVFIYNERLSKKLVSRWRQILIAGFALFSISLFVFLKIYVTKIVRYPAGSPYTSTYIIGNELQNKVKTYLTKKNKLPSEVDHDYLFQNFGEPKDIWVYSSIRSNEYVLAITYMLLVGTTVVLLFTATTLVLNKKK